MTGILKKLVPLFFFGAAAGASISYLSSPKLFSPRRIEESAKQYEQQGEGFKAAQLYKVGAVNQDDRGLRDEMYMKSCRLSRSLGDEAFALRICLEASKGPKRRAGAQALLACAELYRDRENEEEATKLYEDVASQYWDYREGRIAQKELTRLKLKHIFSNDLGLDRYGKINAFIEKNLSADFSSAVARKAVAWTLSIALDEDLKFNPKLFADIQRGYSGEGGKQLLLQLGAISNIHPKGFRLKEAMIENSIPVKDKAEDMIQLALDGDNADPDEVELINYLSSNIDTAALDRLIGDRGNAGMELRNKIARIWLKNGRLKDIIDLLQGLSGSDAPGTGFAQANYLLAQSENELGMKERAAQRYASIIERWPHYPEICVRSARAASELFIELGKQDKAKQVLQSGAKIAKGVDRLDLTRMALEIE